MLDIHNKIKDLRLSKKMTQQQLADTINKTLSTVKKYETGQIMLNIDTLYDIAKALDVNIMYFFSDNNQSLFNNFIEQYGLVSLSDKELEQIRIEFDFMLEVILYKHKSSPK